MSFSDHLFNKSFKRNNLVQPTLVTFYAQMVKKKRIYIDSKWLRNSLIKLLWLSKLFWNLGHVRIQRKKGKNPKTNYDILQGD